MADGMDAPASSDAEFIADACEALCRELASAGRLESQQKVVLASRVAHLLERVEEVAEADAHRAGLTAAAEHALGDELEHAARTERELLLLQAAVLCSGAADRAGMGTGACTTACAGAWRGLTVHGAGRAEGAEGAFAAALVQTKADIMARAVATTEAVQALQVSGHASRGGLWMDYSSQGADLLCEDLVQRRY